jgi:hypothetical protein
MEKISRREAISRMASGGAGVALTLSANELVQAQGSNTETTPARAFRG